MFCRKYASIALRSRGMACHCYSKTFERLQPVSALLLPTRLHAGICAKTRSGGQGSRFLCMIHSERGGNQVGCSMCIGNERR